MDYYKEIKIRENGFIQQYKIMARLFHKIHGRLGRVGMGKIGVSFPHYSEKSMGDILRLHGESKDALQKLDVEGLLLAAKIQDFFEVSDIAHVPENCKYRTVSKYHRNKSPEACYRRGVSRKSISKDEDKTQKLIEIKKNQARHRQEIYPFLQIYSGSNAQFFPLHVKHGDLLDKPKVEEVKFSVYGLSRQTTIPWF